jgi:hypothetical protein
MSSIRLRIASSREHSTHADEQFRHIPPQFALGNPSGPIVRLPNRT